MKLMGPMPPMRRISAETLPEATDVSDEEYHACLDCDHRFVERDPHHFTTACLDCGLTVPTFMAIDALKRIRLLPRHDSHYCDYCNKL